jgi:peroxidase
MILRLILLQAGGQGWPVVLGRRDSLTSHFSQSASFGLDGLPSPFSPLNTTFANFKLRNFSQAETITLSGSHTFGRAHCAAFTLRFNNTPGINLNDTNVNPILKKEILEFCSLGDRNTVVDLDVTTPNIFDNAYYRNLGYELGILHSDQNLVTTPGSNALVQLYSNQNDLFLSAFAKAMVKMQNLSPLTGTEGEIRIKCGEVNPPDSSSRTRSESSIAVE